MHNKAKTKHKTPQTTGENNTQRTNNTRTTALEWTAALAIDGYCNLLVPNLHPRFYCQ